MLCRIPKIRRILNAPRNMNHRGIIVSSIRLQRPFLERRMRESSEGTLIALVKKNVVPISSEGKINGKKVPVSRYPPLPSFPKFCQSVAAEWDRVSSEDVKKLGIPYPWCAPLSPEFKFFSNTRRSMNYGLTIHKKVGEVSADLSYMQELEGFLREGSYPEKDVRAAMAETGARLEASLRILLIKMSLGFNEQIWVEAKNSP